MKRIIVSVCVLSSLLASAAVPRPVNKRAIVMGDSITHGGYCMYYLQLMENLRHPDSTTRYYNAGSNGAQLDRGIAWAASEVARVHPDCAFTMYGMNDVRNWLYTDKEGEPMSAKVKADADASLDLYRSRYPELLHALETNGVTDVTLVTPSPFDEYSNATGERRRFANEYGLTKASEFVRWLATENSHPFVELHAPMTTLVKAYPDELWCGNDRTHPLRPGHLFMAAQYWKAFGETNPVAAVALTRTGTVTATENATVMDVAVTSEGLSFTYAPNALPLPYLEEYETLKAFYPELEDCNRELLSVSGLPGGRWRVELDGRTVGTFSSKQLAAGVNLAECNTPNRRRAAQALEAMQALHDLDYLLRDKRYNGMTVSAEEWAEQERLYQVMDSVAPVSCQVSVSPMSGDGWFDANVDSYLSWPGDAAIAWGGSWSSSAGLGAAATVTTPGQLFVSTSEPLSFDTDAGMGPSAGVTTFSVAAEANLGYYDSEVMPTVDPDCKAGVIAADVDGVKSYYGIIDGAWQKLTGVVPDPANGAVPVVMSFEKDGDAEYVSYAIDGVTCSYGGKTKFAVSVGTVAHIAFKGTGTLRSLTGDADRRRGTFLFVR